MVLRKVIMMFMIFLKKLSAMGRVCMELMKGWFTIMAINGGFNIIFMENYMISH